VVTVPVEVAPSPVTIPVPVPIVPSPVVIPVPVPVAPNSPLQVAPSPVGTPVLVPLAPKSAPNIFVPSPVMIPVPVPVGPLSTPVKVAPSPLMVPVPVPVAPNSPVQVAPSPVGIPVLVPLAPKSAPNIFVPSPVEIPVLVPVGPLSTPVKVAPSPLMVPVPVPMSSVAPSLVFDANFTNTTTLDQFLYADDIFFSTNQPDYANGDYERTGDNRDVITVELGGVDGSHRFNMSGGWQRSFTLGQKSDITITILFQLQIDKNFEPEEYTKVLCSVDTRLVSRDSIDYLAMLAGDGNGKKDRFIDFPSVPVDLSVKDLEAGNHTIAVGGFLSGKNQRPETSWIRFDRVRIISSAAQ
jgi:hypothetical protein